jgi:hypothetical protein
MTYDAAKDSWGLAIEVSGEPGSPTTKATLNVVKGEVTGASLSFTKISFLGRVTINKLDLSYDLTPAGNAVFTAAASFQLPGGAVSGVDVSFTFTNGLFTAGSLLLKGNVPLFGGIFLTALGAEIKLQPVEEIAGTVGLSEGPETPAGRIIGLDGKIDYQFASAAHPSGVYTFTGSMSALKVVLGTAAITADENGITITITLGDEGNGFKVGDLLSLNGSVSGSITVNSFSVTGKVHFAFEYHGHKIAADGTVGLSNVGLVACASLPSVSKKGQTGIAYKWGGTPVLKIGDCAPGSF